MVLNLAVARSDPVRAFVRPAFSSCKCSVCVSIQYKYVTTSVSKKRTFASTEKLRGKNESTLRAWQTKRRQQFGGKSGTNMTGFDRIRCNPVQARPVSVGGRMQTGANRCKAIQNGGAVAQA